MLMYQGKEVTGYLTIEHNIYPCIWWEDEAERVKHGVTIEPDPVPTLPTPAQVKDATNNIIKQKILILEDLITGRVIREFIATPLLVNKETLKTPAQYIDDVNTKIVALRATIIK